LLTNFDRAGFKSKGNGERKVGEVKKLLEDFVIEDLFSPEGPWNHELDPFDEMALRSKKDWASNFVNEWLQYAPDPNNKKLVYAVHRDITSYFKSDRITISSQNPF
jgi:hypothetical protein